MTAKSTVNLNIVHESEAQRQYARVRIPAKITINIDASPFDFSIQDISAGGFSLSDRADLFKLNEFYDATIQFRVDGFSFSMAIKFTVKNINEKENRVGCELCDMGSREIASLRYLLTSTLNGELFSAGDMLNTLARENFTKSRNKNSTSQQSAFQRTKAMTLSILFFCIGLGAFGFVAKSVYQNLLVVHATTAKVDRDSFVVTMPREGQITSLIHAGENVIKGQPIATIQAPLADFLGATISSGLSADLISQIAKTNVAGTINSPCDCVVNIINFTDGQYLAKAANLFELSIPNAPLFVRAWFDVSAIKSIAVGDEVTMDMTNASSYKGKISSVRQPVGTNGPLAQLEVKIELMGENTGLVVDQPLLISKSRF